MANLRIPLETRLELAFNAAGEIEMLLPLMDDAIDWRSFEDTPAVVAYRRIKEVAEALVDIAQPDNDKEHDFEELRAKLTFGGNVEPPPSHANPGDEA